MSTTTTPLKESEDDDDDRRRSPLSRGSLVVLRVARRRDRLLLPGEARAPPDRADDAEVKERIGGGGKDVRDVAGNVSRTPRDGGENADGNEMDEGGNGKNDGRRRRVVAMMTTRVVRWCRGFPALPSSSSLGHYSRGRRKPNDEDARRRRRRKAGSKVV